eukprot:6039710-Pyramimonas_sp.AAC.1
MALDRDSWAGVQRSHRRQLNLLHEHLRANNGPDPCLLSCRQVVHDRSVGNIVWVVMSGSPGASGLRPNAVCIGHVRVTDRR